ncbi:MAG: glycosyl hydrolase [Verrucomicrobiota bacterium]|nr:glycosyl hydrolase [Verrucomicrobiota bacterium]
MSFHPPANPKATPEACALYAFLQQISGKHTLAGQHNFINTGSAYTERLSTITGLQPVVWGSDFSFGCTGVDFPKYQHCGPMNITPPGETARLIDTDPHSARQALVQEAIAQRQKGSIVTLMWHCCFPTDGDFGPGNSIWAMENRPTREVWKQLVTPGTDLHSAWLTQVDRIASYLAQLRDAGVPVLWRPYHEMNGVWFWWCNQPGPDGFAQLWRNLYERFTVHHQLNNLLWVWNTNAPRAKAGDEAFPYADFYPGSDCVDVLAADVYWHDYKQSHHDELVELGGGRPIALGEIGHFPAPHILDEQPRWCWFMAWGNLAYKWNSDQVLRDIYHAPRMMTMESLSRG